MTYSETVQNERRVEPRTPHRAVVIMACGSGERLEFERAELMDWSPHGIGILFHRQLPLGAQFLLKLKPDRVILLSYVVRNCPPDAASFRIGAQFLRQVGHDHADHEPEHVYRALLDS